MERERAPASGPRGWVWVSARATAAPAAAAAGADERGGRLRVDGGRRDAEQGKYGSCQDRLTYGQTVWRRRARDARVIAPSSSTSRGESRVTSPRAVGRLNRVDRAPGLRRDDVRDRRRVLARAGRGVPAIPRDQPREQIGARQGGLGRELCRPRAALHRGCVASPPRAAVSARRGSSSRISRPPSSSLPHRLPRARL